MAYVAIAIFVIAYILIISEKIQRTVVGLTGAMLMIFAGILTQEQAIHHIDFNTIGLLAGMMIIVNITSETGLFNYLAIWSAKKVEANPIKLLLVLSALTAICSAFLDNVTTVLLTVPVTFSITSQLKVPVQPFLVAQILSSNIGGTATLIGDPPNIMIGSAVPELDFMSFITNLGGICIVIFIITMAILIAIYRKKLTTTPELQAKIMQMNEKKELRDTTLLKKCLIVLALTILTFMFHSQLGLESASVALGGASLLMLISISTYEESVAKILSRLEWLAIFFFVGLFVLVGGLMETGVIKAMAVEAFNITDGDVTTTTMLILWLSAIASAFIDNIPFVATLIPMIKEMGAMGMTNLEPLWWALSLGACLGGNGTLIGASANVVVAGMASQHGHKISFISYMKIAFPLMILSIIISSAYIYFRYL
ncbi:Inner membrane protein YbiR [Megamonas hypermegale]|uniref:Inner membrane protein YbiR n=1 Tax=Megamonas hypermegale TaxID=158847 RepID=A0A239U1Z6_9FIRM|nr:ArsB/NhaD family transporter [Megamonas hypermegale]SNV03862.1 Inner membrane protein YbiR [Megamonas hypermegale]